MVARRHLAAGAEQRVEAIDQRQIVEGCVDLGGRKDPHDNGLRGGLRGPDDDSSGATRALWRSIAFRSRGAGPPPVAGDGAAAALWRRRWISRSRRAAPPPASRARRP